MSKEKTAFQVFLEEEVNKVRGIYYPAKAGFMRRVFVRKLPCGKLHPNPHDEFCLPEVGPNYEIVSRYEADYRTVREDPSGAVFLDSGIREPLIVEKTRPEGYMILNGHHRWAAARQAGIKKLPVKIVDLTQEKDIRKMLQSGRSDRRATLDLDEVIFRPEDDSFVEKALRFPLNRVYRERIRLGIPALFHELTGLNYDIWIYTSRYYSLDYLRYYFRHYRVPVTGIVTGTARKAPHDPETVQELRSLFDRKYGTTLHIDSRAVLYTAKGSRDYQEYPLSGSPETWSREVIGIVRKTEAR